MEPSESNLIALAKLLLHTQEGEIDCAEFLESVAAYIEAGGNIADNEMLSEQLRLVRQHMEVCPPCREEFDAMLKACGLD